MRKILSTGGLYYYYPVLNTRGDIIELYGGPGALTARYTYDSWGKLISVVDANGATIGAGRFAHYVSLRYRGYYYDAETELYYLQSRYFDPEVGRFLNADDVNYIGITGTNISYNAFAYCENNAVNDSDPLGNIGRSTLALLLDIVLTLIVPYFSGPLDVFGRIISSYAKRKKFTLLWDKLLYGVVPKFKSAFTRFTTGIRKALWRVAGSAISNSVTTYCGIFVSRFVSFVTKYKFKKAIDIISCFFSAGSMIAGFLDWYDGKFNGKVEFR